MMFKRTPPPPDVTNENYSQWIRAQCPPFDWFMRQDDLVKEQLARIGDDYQQELWEGISVSIGYAVAHPGAAEAGLDAADNPDSEETLLRIAAELAARMVSNPQALSAPTMGGTTARKEAAAQSEQNGKDANRTFLGRAPDRPEVAKSGQAETGRTDTEDTTP